jgi:hypothetical protein
MNIIFGKENISEVEEKYVVLELDTLRVQGLLEPITAYCVIENVGINNLPRVPEFKDLHQNLMINYRKRDWSYCQNALEYLTGFWGGEMDSFYQEINKRIEQFKQSDPGEAWDGIIDKT